MTFPAYKLTLHKTYYEKGFFNLGVAVEKYVRPKNGSVFIFLGPELKRIMGHVNRDANLNGTPRVFGGHELRDWFFANYRMGDVVTVHIESPNQLYITD